MKLFDYTKYALIGYGITMIGIPWWITLVPFVLFFAFLVLKEFKRMLNSGPVDYPVFPEDEAKKVVINPEDPAYLAKFMPRA